MGDWERAKPDFQGGKTEGIHNPYLKPSGLDVFWVQMFFCILGKANQCLHRTAYTIPGRVWCLMTRQSQRVGKAVHHFQSVLPEEVLKAQVFRVFKVTGLRERLGVDEGKPSKKDNMSKDSCVLLSAWEGVSAGVRRRTAQPHRRQGVWTQGRDGQRAKRGVGRVRDGC